MHRVGVRRTDHLLRPEDRRVLAKPYMPGEEIIPGGDSRASALMQRILAIPEDEVVGLLAPIVASFSPRHYDFLEMLDRNFTLVAHHMGIATARLSHTLSEARKRLIGAYYTHEYSIEGAALFNPSIVVGPDQSGLAAGERRLIMSLRAVGEGHISSIEFQTVVVDALSRIRFEPRGTKLVAGTRTAPSVYEKKRFRAKLGELHAGNQIAWSVLERLPDRFTLVQLEGSLSGLLEEGGESQHAVHFETAKIIRLLAASNYVTTFPKNSALAERVLFPASPHETRGMEDARFVRFVEKDGKTTYYATYTAYDGFNILPQLIETTDFRSFSISTLNGTAAQNKGMALFPRRIHGKYVMLSRKDRENLHLSTSDDVHFWHDVVDLDRPQCPWELVQIGNCGSPIETEAGWLVITHGVGAMRRYALGAILLDIDEPTRVIGRLSYPLLEPNEEEREGYVPNVVYSCGQVANGKDLILPYGISDGAIGMAFVSIPDLLDALRSNS